jgi:glycosyltransferase involved in cell wall biosynthesis
MEVKYKIADRSLEKNVRLAGTLPPLQLAELLVGSDLLVVPSYYEGFGIVYLEGMGFGIPSVATTAGGAGELVRDGENGYLIDPGDVRSLIQILQRIMSDRDRLRALSLGALRTYHDHPTWGEGVGQARDFLQSFIDGTNQPQG